MERNEFYKITAEVLESYQNFEDLYNGFKEVNSHMFMVLDDELNIIRDAVKKIEKSGKHDPVINNALYDINTMLDLIYKSNE